MNVMIEAVGAAVYMGDSEEAFHWIEEINRRLEDKTVRQGTVSSR